MLNAMLPPHASKKIILREEVLTTQFDSFDRISVLFSLSSLLLWYNIERQVLEKK